MKKLLLLIPIAALILFAFTGCSGKTYSFKEPTEEIESIEIVSAESSLDYTVIKTLSETEKSDFLEQFQKIMFHKSWGDPVKVHGDAIKITYQNGNYEMICSYGAEYVENGVRWFIRKGCDETAFNELLETFLQET